MSKQPKKRKVWRKKLARTESWKGQKVSVIRVPAGQKGAGRIVTYNLKRKVQPKLAWHTPDGRVYVHPSIKNRRDRARLVRHEKQYLKAREQGKSWSQAVKIARQEEHKGMSAKVVQRYEGRLGAQARRIKRQWLLSKPEKPSRRRQKRLTYEVKPLEKEAPKHITVARFARERMAEEQARVERIRNKRVAVYDHDRRIEFSGSGHELYLAVKKAKTRGDPRKGYNRVPRGYVSVDAEAYLQNPGRYEEQGDWDVDVEVKS